MKESNNVAEDNRGAWFAVCCTTEVSAKRLNSFLEDAYNFPLNSTKQLVIVDDLSKTYSDPSEPPLANGLSPAPFANKDASGCASTLRAMVADTRSNLDHDHFAVIDERTIHDSTVLLCAVGERSGLRTLRAAADVTNFVLSSWSAGVGSIEEDRDIADDEGDGVYRMHKPDTGGGSGSGMDGSERTMPASSLT